MLRRARLAKCKKIGDLVSLADHVKNVHGVAKPTEKDIVQNLDYGHTCAILRSWPRRGAQA
ncbi:hypothetical protein B0H34DRAFT_693022 [Crassisporium funariophilum]|nr:hypothetical protein B0H34DRAFT_693022 [Crassisporium funariophilum]